MNNEVFCSLYRSGYIKPKSKNYIWLPEMEFISEQEARERQKRWQDICDLEGMTVFAVNGGGDMFVWDSSDMVYFAEHDTGVKTLFARSLADALFRRIIEFAAGEYAELCTDSEKADMDESDAQDYISESEARDMIRSCRSAFGEYLSDEQVSVLEEIISSPLDETGGFITYERCRELTMLIP
ncbi:MAG: hypothetical protein IK990_18560 [Ruminiclostridium sp.]|nr:hypothetical protein [Ruminiclostridium sp.]